MKKVIYVESQPVVSLQCNLPRTLHMFRRIGIPCVTAYYKFDRWIFFVISKSIIYAVTRDPYKYLTNGKFSLTLKIFGERDVKTQDQHHEITP